MPVYSPDGSALLRVSALPALGAVHEFNTPGSNPNSN